MPATRIFYYMVTAFFILSVLSLPGYAEKKVISKRVGVEPIIDGVADDPAWKECEYFFTRDKVGGVDIKLKVAHTSDHIFFLVQFPDPDESRLHKTLIWNKTSRMYDVGPDREDTFVIKWSMDKNIKNLSVYSDTPYTADTWFWKAHRTDPAGYADDKLQILSSSKIPKSMAIKSTNGKMMYLKRSGDKGKPAYQGIIQIEYKGDKLSQFTSKTPSGSRADILAKGVWKDKMWSIEFSRRLDTGHPDDVQFDLSRTYAFGVSRYEIAARQPNYKLTQPLYGAGDTSELLQLSFTP